MPAANRSAGRNVFIYDSKDPTKVLGGLVLTNGVTNANFYFMVEILFIFTITFELQLNEADATIPRNGDPLQAGNYYIITSCSFSVSDEAWLVRTISHSTGTRTPAFRDAIRLRDPRCVITGEEAINADVGSWTGFDAAHIFPLAYEGHWKQHNFDRWITKPSVKGGSINSVQNGLLLRSDIRQLFDTYGVSINPDDDHRITFFARDGKNIAGQHLDQRFLNNPDRPVDQLLRWHFRQSVLANMRGNGVPHFEHDFPPGSDILGDIRDGPMPEETMEFELFSRLTAVQDI
ncbi:MAG: hypothetical protein FRX48_04805 [Lasallia pustulata]|uniref:Uncharacterized protein n=1 Tax=Lasallia pustulata TaxID=136370 RepID=A0A5M8PRE1_9LECA|nr:MAG: hypothetical protein FRX48_04805 [Lasallia pustulata]